ncbi:UNVERIFIED_CONTAM: hypothetical protein GTU68_007575 [Idotea baltica]|nr:hypothetical protein [Idotea baltica]
MAPYLCQAKDRENCSSQLWASVFGAELTPKTAMSLMNTTRLKAKTLKVKFW